MFIYKDIVAVVLGKKLRKKASILKLLKKLAFQTDRFFVHPKDKVSEVHEYFQDYAVGMNQLNPYLCTMCRKTDVSETGAKDRLRADRQPRKGHGHGDRTGDLLGPIR